MPNIVRLTCTITEEDMKKHSEEILLRSYFPVEVMTRTGKHYKYYSLASKDSIHVIMDALEKILESLQISNYAFNISTDYLLESVSS